MHQLYTLQYNLHETQQQPKDSDNGDKPKCPILQRVSFIADKVGQRLWSGVSQFLGDQLDSLAVDWKISGDEVDGQIWWYVG